MKKITLLLTLVFTTSLMFSQVVLTEDFEAGLTVPSGWTIEDLASPANGEIWTIETGGEAGGFTSPNTLIYDNGGVGNYATMDSDGYGNNSTAESTTLTSPVFDASSLTSVSLSFDTVYNGNFGGLGEIEVFNGTAWVNVQTYATAAGDTPNTTESGFQLFDVSVLAGVSNAQIRFKWTGNWSISWSIDNISVFQCTVSAPNAVAAVVAPTDAEIDVEISYGATTNTVGPFEWTPSTTGDSADSYNINLGITPAGGDIGVLEGFSNGTFLIFTWEPNTTYYWSIDAVNCAGVTAGPIWSFTTQACTETAAPALATSPSPADVATAVALQAPDASADFSWTAANADDTFILNLGIANPPTQSFNDFENGGTITGLDLNTTYYWSVDVVNCVGITTGTVWSFTTDAALGVEDNTFNTFSAYPNPTSGILNIKSSQDVDNVTVFNLLGQNVASFSKNEITNSSIDMSGLSKGLYLVKVTSGDKTETLRVTKE
ncbi:T9SS type A sorting domain-containing protein [uncultured Winogradskyella sp.]|uniref:T9SS type A sorting domain-containing protein n=1 Tax=uncultured Winogradskyella sp. TaxID=395353 RepID=UPI0030EB4A31